MYVENASRSTGTGVITPENLEPNPKNPIIAAFFRNIGLADQLGSGVRNLFKYSKYYSGKDPEFEEGDVFRIVVPLDKPEQTQARPKPDPSQTRGAAILGEREQKIVALILEKPEITQKEMADRSGYKLNSVKTLIRKLKEKGVISRVGTSQNGYWKVE